MKKAVVGCVVFHRVCVFILRHSSVSESTMNSVHMKYSTAGNEV